MAFLPSWYFFSVDSTSSASQAPPHAGQTTFCFVEYYLTTREDGNYLYMLVVLPMKGDNNSPQSDDVQYKDVYVMAFVEDVYIGEDGAIHYSEDKLNFDGSSEYNFFWHADFDKDLLVREFVSAKEVDPEKPYIVHMFMV